MGQDLGKCVDCNCQSFDAKETVAGEAVKAGLIGGGGAAAGFALGVGLSLITGGAAAPFVVAGLGSACGATAGGSAAVTGTIAAVNANNHTCRCGHQKHRHALSS